MDPGLVRSAQQGDRDAFAVLAAQTVDRLYAVARVVVRDADRAEDAVQETLIRCWRDLPSLRDADRFEVWQRRILMHCITEEFRRGRRFEAQVKVLRAEPRDPDATTALEDRDRLERGFSRLSVEHRVILTLRHLHGLSLAEVADTLEIPVGTAKSRLHYATDAMRAAITADDRTTSREEASA